MPNITSPKQALQNWAEANHVTPPQFAAAMGYTYNHAYQVLRGNAEVTLDMLGRFVVAYGTEAAQQIASAFTEYADMDGAVVVQPPAASQQRRTTRKTSNAATVIGTIPGLRKGVTA